MDIFNSPKTHSFKESDFEPDEIHHLKGDKIHDSEVQVFMTVAFRDGKLYILNASYNEDSETTK